MICGMLVLTSLLREITEWICSVLLHLCEGVSSRRRWRRGCWKNKSRGGGGRGRYICRGWIDKHWKRCREEYRLQEDEKEEEDAAHWQRGLREQRWAKGHLKKGVGAELKKWRTGRQHRELAWRSVGSVTINCIIKRVAILPWWYLKPLKDLCIPPHLLKPRKQDGRLHWSIWNVNKEAQRGPQRGTHSPLFFPFSLSSLPPGSSSCSDSPSTSSFSLTNTPCTCLADWFVHPVQNAHAHVCTDLKLESRYDGAILIICPPLLYAVGITDQIVRLHLLWKQNVFIGV